MSDKSVSDADLLQHGRELFVYHAGQRLITIRYFFVAYAIFAAGYIGAMTPATTGGQDIGGLRLLITFLAFVITIAFWALDARNSELVKIDEASLKEIERIIQKNKSLTYFNIHERADCPKNTILQYSYVVNIMYFIFFIITFLVGAFELRAVLRGAT